MLFLFAFSFIYVNHHRAKKWVPRKRGADRITSRMYSVSATDTDKFHLRPLLLHVPGATSYTDLKTVNRVVCASFQDARIQSHLLTDDNQHSETIAEASNFQMPNNFAVFLPLSASTVSILIH